MLKKVIFITNAILYVSIIGLVISTLAFDNYFRTHPLAEQSLRAANGDTELLKKACNDIHLPALASSVNIFMPLMLVVTLVGIIIFAICVRKNIKYKANTFLLLGIVISIVTYLVIQLWEPDFFYVICHLI